MEKHNEHKNNQKIPNVSKDHEVEYSEELADIEDREAQARAKAAQQRVNKDNI